MPNIKNAFRTPVVSVLVVLAFACLGLTACGGSSGSTASQSNAAATSTAGASTGTSTSSASPSSGSSGQGNRPPNGNPRFAAVRECLQKNGITLPKRTPGAGGPSGRPGLPKGVTPAQYAAAVKKCGGGGRFGAGNGHFQRANNPVFKQALAKFGACLRQNGINIAAPNTSGKGPIFSTKGIDTRSPQFRAATAKCRSTLTAALRPQGANGASGAGGSTPNAGQPAGG
jgi:hypothetical protein